MFKAFGKASEVFALFDSLSGRDHEVVTITMFFFSIDEK